MSKELTGKGSACSGGWEKPLALGWAYLCESTRPLALEQPRPCLGGPGLCFSAPLR